MSMSGPTLPDYANTKAYARSHAAHKAADLQNHIESIKADRKYYDAKLAERQLTEDREYKYNELMKARIAAHDTPKAPVAANRMIVASSKMSNKKSNGGKSKRHFRSKSKSKSNKYRSRSRHH